MPEALKKKDWVEVDPIDQLHSVVEIQKIVAVKLSKILPPMINATVEDNTRTSCAVNIALVPDDSEKASAPYILKITAKLTMGDEAMSFGCEVNNDKQLLIQFEE